MPRLTIEVLEQLHDDCYDRWFYEERPCEACAALLSVEVANA